MAGDPSAPELCVSTSLTNLARIAEFVGQYAAAAGLEADGVHAVQAAVDEACTNVIEHAYGGETNGEIRVCCWVEKRDLVVRVTDFGRSFDPREVPDPDLTTPLETRSLGGLGLYLMRQLMDSVEFTTGGEQGGNQLIMRKRLPSPD